MPKERSNSEKIERYKRKLQDLENRNEKCKRRRRRRHRSISDDTECDQGENHLQNQDSTRPAIDKDQSPVDEFVPHPVLETQMEMEVQATAGPSSPPIVEAMSTDPAPAPPDATTESAAPAAAPPAPAIATEPPLDPALLAALGEPTSDTPEFGTTIHDSLANIWLPLLKKGMNKEAREKLLKEYPIPVNCKLLQAPKLNAEISAAVAEVVRGRDKKYIAVQQQLGQGIASINRAMDVLLMSDNKIEALTKLSDGCRILSDLHHFFTKDRIKLIIPSLEKNFLHVIQDTERDEHLFGNTLSEKIKASKAIEKQGHQIKKSVSIPKPNTYTNTTSARSFTSQGNWSAAPRYSSNRGGRGGSRKTNPSPATRRPYIPAPPPPPRFATQGKPRAQAPHQ